MKLRYYINKLLKLCRFPPIPRESTLAELRGQSTEVPSWFSMLTGCCGVESIHCAERWHCTQSHEKGRSERTNEDLANSSSTILNPELPQSSKIPRIRNWNVEVTLQKHGEERGFSSNVALQSVTLHQAAKEQLSPSQPGVPRCYLDSTTWQDMED